MRYFLYGPAFDSFEIENTLQALCFSGFGGYLHFVLKL